MELLSGAPMCGFLIWPEIPHHMATKDKHPGVEVGAALHFMTQSWTSYSLTSTAVAKVPPPIFKWTEHRPHHSVEACQYHLLGRACETEYMIVWPSLENIVCLASSNHNSSYHIPPTCKIY